MSGLARILVPLMAALLVTACGTASDGPILNLARSALEDAQAADRPSLEAQQAVVAQAVRESGSASPALMVALPGRNAVASLVVGAQNAGAVTWLDTTGISVVTRRGVVIATRGLGLDVMASDVSGTLSAFDRGATGYVRLQKFLDGEGHLNDRPLTCDAARAGSRITETCRGDGVSVTNTYDLQGGEVVRSRQWLGEAIGYAQLTRLQ